MQNGDEDLKKINLAGRGLLVKKSRRPEPHPNIFWSNFAYLYTLTLSRHWYAKRLQGFAVDKSERSWSDAYSSFTPWYILIKISELKQISIIWNVHITWSFAELYQCSWYKHPKTNKVPMLQATKNKTKHTQTHFSLETCSHMVYFDTIIYHSARNDQFTFHTFLLAPDTDLSTFTDGSYNIHITVISVDF